MQQTDTTVTEKLVINMMARDPKLFRLGQAGFFRNTDIRDIYESLSSYYKSVGGELIQLNPSQIANVVRTTGKDIDNDLVKAIFNEDLAAYESTWLENIFVEWKGLNDFETFCKHTIDKFRDVRDNGLDRSKLLSTIGALRESLDTLRPAMSKSKSKALDFDEPDDHIQSLGSEKISTGFHTMDSVFQGGWEPKTLNVLMGMTNSGKSVWLNNFAVNAADNGYNVLYVTLEMEDRKVMKRLGSIRLNIPIRDYAAQSKDAAYMKNKLDSLRKRGFGERKLGKLFVKEFPISCATSADIDAFVEELENETGLKIHMLVVDYLGIMGVERGTDNTLYLIGKYRAEGLRAIAQKRELACITAVQMNKDKYNTEMAGIEDIPESKAIGETADNVGVIIRTEQMKKENRYLFKFLKLRDSDFKRDTILFDFNPDNLRVINDRFPNE